MEERIYTVYQFIFPDGKMYFGCTKHPKIRHTPGQYARMAVGKPIKQYGIENITIKIIVSNLSKADAYKIENWLIERYDTTNPEKGWNKVHENMFSSLIVGEDAKRKSDKYYHDIHKEEVRIRNKEYQTKHREELSRKRAIWWEENKDKIHKRRRLKRLEKKQKSNSA